MTVFAMHAQGVADGQEQMHGKAAERQAAVVLVGQYRILHHVLSALLERSLMANQAVDAEIGARLARRRQGTVGSCVAYAAMADGERAGGGWGQHVAPGD